MTSLDSELSQLEKDISAKEDQIENTKAELEEAKAVEKEQYASMKLRIQYMYENGNVSFADSIMTSKNASQLLNRAEYASQIATYDRKMLKEYQATREKINQKEQDLETEHSNLLALQESTEAKQASVKELMSSKQKELTSYNSQIGAAQSSIDQYNADIKAQENQMKAIEAEMKRKEEEARKKAEAQKKTYNVTNLGNISFKWPCPSSGRITSGLAEESRLPRARPAITRVLIFRPVQELPLWQLPWYGSDRYIQLFSGKLYYDRPWRRRQHRLHALLPASCKPGTEGEKGTDHCKSGLYRIFYRFSFTFWSPFRWKLCKSK